MSTSDSYSDLVLLMAHDESKHLIWADVDTSETLQAQ